MPVSWHLVPADRKVRPDRVDRRMDGHLPDKKTLDDFSRLIGNLRVLPEGFAEDMILKAPSKNIMNKIARSVLASYSYDSNPDDISTGNILRQN